MTRDIFDPLFELQDSRLDRLGNPLIELERCQAGAPTRDVLMMFRGLVIHNLYGLSDEQLEYQIEDRRSSMAASSSMSIY